MYHDFEPNTLFYTEKNTVRINDYKKQLKSDILNGKIKSNIEGLKDALLNGIPARAYLEVIEELKNKVIITGKFNRKITNIHRLKNEDIYKIKTLP